MAKSAQTQAHPKTQTFSLKTPYLSAGRITALAAKTDNLWIHTKVNAEGGENAMHTHTGEDHAFIVLEGEVTFYDEHNEGTVLKQFEGIMIPKGAYYRYLNTGPGNLIVIRVGAATQDNSQGATRLDPDGRPLRGDSPENKHIEPVPIPGKFFGA